MNDSIFWTLVTAAGVILAWLVIHLLWTLRPRRMWRKIKCLLGDHASGPVKAEVGGRNVQRCLYCDKVVYEYTVTKGSIRRTS